jgi:hypothetical protein
VHAQLQTAPRVHSGVSPGPIAALLGALALALPCAAAAQSVTPVTAPGQISNTGSPLDFGTGAEAPALSYDPVSRRVLALWGVRGRGDTRTIVMRVLDARGTPLGAQIALPGFDAATGAVAVAARPRRGGWVVVASVEVAARATRIVSAFVERSGVPSRRRGISAAAPFSGAGVESPRIAFDPNGGDGVIAWFLDGQHGRGGVYARSVDTSGRPAARVRAIYRSPKGADSIDGSLALGFQPRTHRWLVVWRRFLSFASTQRSVPNNLYARRVLRDGRPRGPIHTLGRPTDFRNASLGTPTLVADTGSARALVMYPISSADGRNRLQAVRLDAGGAALSRRARTLTSLEEPLAAMSPSAVAVASSGLSLTYVLGCAPVGHEGCPQFSPIIRRALTSSITPAGAPSVLVADAVGRRAAFVATGPRTSLLAWEGAALSGPPTFDDTAMATVFPHKSEIFVRPL